MHTEAKKQQLGKEREECWRRSEQVAGVNTSLFDWYRSEQVAGTSRDLFEYRSEQVAGIRKTPFLMLVFFC